MATHLQDFMAAVEAKFQTEIAALYPGLAIKWPNAKWTEPVNGATWIDFSVILGDTVNVNIGPDHWERQSVVLHMCVVCPTETYTRAAIGIAENAGRIFGNQQFAAGSRHSVTLRAPMTRIDDGKQGKFRVITKVLGQRDCYVGPAS